jgi:hypothetical protein
MQKTQDNQQRLKEELEDWRYSILKHMQRCCNQTVWYWQKSKEIHQLSRIAGSEIDLHSQLSFHKETKAIWYRNDTLSNYWIATFKMKSESRHRPYILYKNQIKMDHSLKHKVKTIQLLDSNIIENLNDLGFDNDLLDETPKT